MKTKPVVSVRASALPVMREAEAKAAKIAKRLGVEAPTLRVVETFMTRDEETDKWVEMAKVEFTNTNLSLGDYEFLALVSHQDGVVTAVPGAPDGTVARFSDLEPTCDHCGTRRQRNATYVVVGRDGEEKRVGKNCLRDFLGHKDLDVAALNAYWALLAVWTDDDDERVGGWGGKMTLTTMEILAASCAAIGASGYVRADSEVGLPTKGLVLRMLTETVSVRRGELPAVTEADVARAIEVREWVRATTETTDFAVRMRQVVEVQGDATKYIGTIAFMPEAYRRHLQAEAEKVALAKTETPLSPCPIGKIVLTGEVIGVSYQETAYGSTRKLIVLDDRGFKVYVTEPKCIVADRGDRVSMTVTVEAISEKDNTFGFGKRPSKATVLAVAEAAS